ncbi:putative signal-recognition-particle assembly has a crucial role in targeting secretory proteins to the rough endoplasmic reticulum membrane [Lyophyllum shimeji]|uniref:Signal recognition particle subunit SRP68 n=1 Tax=Lyophyllum shimeji TaxID=47721 RepID=A0A9P3PJI4_LYOSH|nr:putative signal-recognition-particle assembly has a crucial role in targeting secretory proteins to the rough endoplasmic reticulum membrane [Lyophyllum shimeji]
MADQGTKPVMAFAALQLANEQRSAHGLRYNDFTRYRKHCTNRTHRLRSTLKMTHGKGRDFKKLPPLTSENVKDGHLQLLLFEAERAWAFSQDLSAQALKPGNEAHASTLRHSATGRFRRAVHWATQLLSHAQALHAAGRLTTAHLLQATVYTLLMNGRFLRSRDDFDDALAQLGVARGVLDVLAESARTSREQALYVLFADEVGPEIRYCAHELGRERAYDVDAIVKEVSARWREELVQGCGALLETLGQEGRAEEGRKMLGELSWEGTPVPIRNPELVDVLLKVQEAEARLDSEKKETRSKKGVAAYDAILLALSDAEEVARKLMEAQQLSGSTSLGATSAAGGRDIQFVHAYIVYQLLSRRIQRDLLLVSVLLSTSKTTPVKKAAARGQRAKPEQVDSRLYPAVVKLLDTVLQSLDQMRTLSIVDDNPDLASAVEARTSVTKARRCLFLARCYAPVKRYAEALTLIRHANIHVRETTSTLSLCTTDPISTGTPAYFPLTSADVKALDAELASDSLQFKREWFAYNGGAVDLDGDGAQAKDYKKPLFFNIALNYVELDMDRLLVRAGKQPPPPPMAEVQQQPTQVVEKEKKPVSKAKVEEVRAPTPEPPAPSRGGLSSLLGGWWGRS